MADELITYLNDHLAGARFAIDLLTGLSEQVVDPSTAQLAAKLLVEIEADRSLLQELIERVGGESSGIKEAAAWMAQKAGRLKFDLAVPIGVFEALEMLTLGVQGKLALWNALAVIQPTDPRLAVLNIAELASRARDQFAAIEERRLALAPAALQTRGE